MEILVIGLVLFLGVHSVRIVADGWRTSTIARIGLLPWKGIYAVLSIAGLALLVWGYGMTRAAPALWYPPVWTRHITALLTLVSFILLAAAYVPGNAIKAKVGHPMIAGVKVWAFAHLLSNGRAGDVLLFGAFLVWAVLDFIASRRRDRAAGTTYPSLGAARTAMAVAAGLVAYVAFALWLHVWLIGVRPY
jgi:uncharacterized membrane protein